MSCRPSTVKLPLTSEEIDGRTVTFKPVKDGIDSEVSGVLQVIEDADGFAVNASYVISQDPPRSHVYWFDQSEIDAIARSLVKQKRRILIVDDDPESTHLVKILLEKTGNYLVREENDPDEAHQSARNFRPDAILLDIMMPGISGWEVTAALLAERSTDQIPIIFISARTEPSDRIRAYELGAQAYLMKPFDPDVLAETVATVLGQIEHGDRDAALAETLASLRKEQVSAGKTRPS